MCGRFSNTATPAQLKASFKVQMPASRGHNAEPRWNIAPSLEVDTITATRGQNMLRPMIWGVATPQSSRPLINARSETMFEKPTFRRAAESQRCIVVASGWYEWIGPKKPYYITRKDALPLAMGGLYWQDGGSSRCVVVTTAADGQLADIHHRAPLVIEAENLATWLNADLGHDDVKPIIAPSHAGLFAWHPVSAEVGSTRVNHEGLIALDEDHGHKPDDQMSLF